MHHEQHSKTNHDHTLNTGINLHSFLQFLKRCILREQRDDLEETKDTQQSIKTRQSCETDEFIDFGIRLLSASC